MINAYSVDAVRRAESVAMAGLPDGVLMQRAAAALASAVARLLPRVYGSRVVLLVGSGSNGGDALFAGARLARRGAKVSALLVGAHAHQQGLEALRAAGGAIHSIPALAQGALTPIGLAQGATAPNAGAPNAGTPNAGAPNRGAWVVVDGLLGIGGRAGLTGPAADLVSSLPADVPIVAVDLPSGIDPHTGEVGPGAVVADLTVTFGVAKPGLLLPPATGNVGRLEVVDIGLDVGAERPQVVSFEPQDIADRWPRPGRDSDKYRRGVLGVVAGGARYTGAAVLSVGAAVRSGAGMVRYLGPDSAADVVRAHWPQAVLAPGRVQAWVLGPGLDPAADDGQRHRAERALASELPCLVDAGALDLLDPAWPRTAPTLLTPHAGELARLLTRLGGTVSRADVETRPLEHAQRAADLTGATVLLKGATTLVVAPSGNTDTPAIAQPDGPAWLATAGSGDVLAGLAGTLLAAGLQPQVAGALAAAVHGATGHAVSAGGPLDATRLLDGLPATIAGMLRHLPA